MKKQIKSKCIYCGEEIGRLDERLWGGKIDVGTWVHTYWHIDCLENAEEQGYKLEHSKDK